jgi:eukaryotic-like serine/threonine-protein kinase
MKPPLSLNQLLFIAASNFSVEEERRAFLEFACRGDEVRLKRLEVLLEARRDADEFFELQPTVVEKAAGEGGEEGGLGTRIGPYRLIDRLGAGGCGVVYLAEQQEPVRRKVALKIIRLGMDSESVIARFAMERESLALMDHPNIARVLDAGATFSGRPYFVMELVDGERITDFCDLKHFGVRERMELFIQVCEAIQHAHQKGVIHRDIKPSNVLVRDHDGRAVPKVIDFGISQATSADVEGDATFAGSGTPSYMSPEQAEGSNDIDTRSDIYSLGALLCELLTSRPPVNHEQFKERCVEGAGAPPEHPVPQLTGDLDWIVRKAVAKDRQCRYETANGLAMDVRRYLNEEPVTARPPSRRYLFTKLVRRNWVIFAAGSVAMFGLLGGFGVSTWLFLRERESRHEAEHARANEVLLSEKARAADLVARATVHVKYNEMEQADSLLAGLTVEKTPLSLEAANTLRTVADWNLTKGRWKTAAKRFSILVPVITSVDLTDTDQMSRILMPAATAIKEWGEPAEYDHLRGLAIRRFADSSNDAVAAQVTKAVLLEPADEATLRGLVSLSAVLESALTGKGVDNNLYVSAWRQFSLALLAYRQGNFERAVYWARKSSASAKIDQLKVSIRILLVMIDLRQGRPEDARATLKDARRQIERWEASPFQLGTTVDFWFDWGNARILLKEAEHLLAAPVR